MSRRSIIILAILSIISTGVGGFVTYYEQRESVAPAPLVAAVVVNPTE